MKIDKKKEEAKRSAVRAVTQWNERRFLRTEVICNLPEGQPITATTDGRAELSSGRDKKAMVWINTTGDNRKLYVELSRLTIQQKEAAQ